MTTVEKDNVIKAARDLGLKEGDIVLIHSSMKSMGYVDGGPETVIQGFLSAIGKNGTLAMPSLVQRDFFNAYKTWDKETSPSDVGYMTEYFRTREGTLRSDQATHSVCAAGKEAEELTGEHTAFGPRTGKFGDYAFSHSSPWQKLYDKNAKMVFIGCSLEKATIRHLAEYMITEKILENHPEIEPLVRKFAEPLSKFWPEIDSDSVYEVLKKHGDIAFAKCGDAKCMCIGARIFVDKAINIVIKNPEKYSQYFLGEDKETYTQWIKGVM